MKTIRWIGTSLSDLSSFPQEARRDAGAQLFLVQTGLEPKDWKPMPSVGAGANEIRVQAGGQWRVLYVAKFADAVYVLHAFGKKTQRAARADIDIAAKRYGELVSALKAAK
jgi:phage-related protein